MLKERGKRLCLACSQRLGIPGIHVVGNTVINEIYAAVSKT
jgi:hypothetical protein